MVEVKLLVPHRLGLPLEIVHGAILNVKGLDIPRLRKVLYSHPSAALQPTRALIGLSALASYHRFFHHSPARHRTRFVWKVAGCINRQSRQGIVRAFPEKQCVLGKPHSLENHTFQFHCDRVTFAFCDGPLANGTRGQEKGRETLQAVNGADLTRARWSSMTSAANTFEVHLPRGPQYS